MKYESEGKKQYELDEEIAEEFSPDPFSEEPITHIIRHDGRANRKYNGQVANNKEENKE